MSQVGHKRTDNKIRDFEAMNVCIVELTTNPADEHFNQQGFAVRVEISYDESGCRSASYWRRTTHAMQWMEHENDPEIRVGAPSELREEVAASILGLVRSARIGPNVEGLHGYIHATKFQLTISSIFFSCNLSWFAELPSEWSELQPAVQALESIGRE